MNAGKYIEQVKYRGRNQKTETRRKEGSRGGSGDPSAGLLGKDGGGGTDLSFSYGLN